MRRILGIALLALFGFSLISPAVFALDAASNLPECCRRDGAHHCSMSMSHTQTPAGVALQTARCARFPGPHGIPVSPALALPPVREAIFAELISHPASCARMEALCRISYSRAGQKRGPPVTLS